MAIAAGVTPVPATGADGRPARMGARASPDGLPALVERNRDVDHGVVELLDEDRLARQEIHPVETGHTSDDERRESAVERGRPVPELRVDVKADRSIRIDRQ